MVDFLRKAFSFALKQAATKKGLAIASPLSVEVLEDRLVPSQIWTVTSLDNAGDGTLRNVIANAGGYRRVHYSGRQ